MTLSDLRTRLFQRVGEASTDGSGWWTTAEANAALNWAQRFFCLLTLVLEDTRDLTLTPGERYYHLMQDVRFQDWIAPLRIRFSNVISPGASAEWGAPEENTVEPNQQLTPNLARSNAPKLLPSNLAGFDAMSDTWETDTGTPSHYALLKTELLAVNRAVTIEGVSLLITYARAPQPMINDTDRAEIPDSDQPALVDLAQVILRLKEGGQELAKAAPLVGRFLEVAKRRAAAVRARSLAQRYDLVPMELERVELSRSLKIRPGLPPHRKESGWPT